MSGHAKLSPSKLHRYMRCPGAVREEAKYPETDSPAAVDGTHTHVLLEHCVKNDLMDPMLLVGTTMTSERGTFEVEIERAERVSFALGYIRNRQSELGTVLIRAEEQVDAGQWFGRDDIKGTADVQLISDTVLEVIDYKDGMGQVAAEGNEQLLTYAAGAVFPYMTTGEPVPFKEIRLTIIQPKLRDVGENPVPYVTIDGYKLMDFLEELRAAALACDAPDAPLVPGDIQCKWCRAKANCPQLQERALAEAQVLFEGEILEPEKIAELDARGLPDDRLAQIILSKSLIDIFLTAVSEEALRRIETGHPLPGLKVVRGRGSRAWVDEALTAKKLKGMGVPKSTMYVEKLVSPAQAEKMSWESKGKKKSLTDKQLKTMRETLIESKQGKLTVVPESDSRKAVVTDAQVLFAEVETQPEAPALPAWLQ